MKKNIGFLVYLILPTAFFACKKDDAAIIPDYPASIFTVMQKPGERLTFDFAFSADQENLILIQKAGQVVVSKNIDQADALLPFDTGINPTAAPIAYQITHKFKTQRGNSPWLNGAGRTDTISNEQINFEFDDRDAVDADFNDAVVKVTFSQK